MVTNRQCYGVSSPIPPFLNYSHTIEIENGDLWWTVNDTAEEITFELHVNTTGWIGIGITPTGGMTGADIGIGWIDSAGKVYLQDRYASGEAKPMIDNTTQDWFVLQGREQNGWTAIQFKRAFDTCDYMDYPIKSGTNHLIFAYGLVDPDPSQPDHDITYHENRRSSRSLPLRSYNDPPSEDKFAGLDTLQWRANNYEIPAVGTTYHCKVFKAPSEYTTKRHGVANKILIDPNNAPLIHHLLLYECDPSAVFDDSNLPDGVCDQIANQLKLCLSNIATGWAVGGDYLLEFPPEAGYPLGGDSPIKYYVVETHYNNPNLISGRLDSTGVQFYIANELRQFDLGILTLGTKSTAAALTIPPQVNEFIVDTYCPMSATQNFPATGITVTAAFPHTHLQGHTVWSKLIRNNTAVKYIFDADAFDFNYQYSNLLPERIQLFPGDEFATRCMYRTTNKNNVTIGGPKTTDEMCLHMLTYFPRMNNYYECTNIIHPEAWQKLMNTSTIPTMVQIRQFVLNIEWTPKLATDLQVFYNVSSRLVFVGDSGPSSERITLPNLPVYQDLPPDTCSKNKTTQVFF